MSTIKAGLYAKLVSLGVCDNIYEKRLPENPTYPAIIYRMVGQEPVSHTHDVNVVGPRKPRFQIDVYTEKDDIATCESIMESIYQALAGFAGQLSADFADVSIFDAGAVGEEEFEEEAILRDNCLRSHTFYVQY